MSEGKNILTVLKKMQQEYGVLNEEALTILASEREIPLNEVFSVASFYSFFSTKVPKGKYVIKVCKSLPCYIKGSANIIEVLKDRLKINPGETTQDRKFSLELVNCIGACDIAPAMLVNERLYGLLTQERINQIIDGCN